MIYAARVTSIQPLSNHESLVGLPLFSQQLSLSAGTFPNPEGERIVGPMLLKNTAVIGSLFGVVLFTRFILIEIL